VLESHNNSPYPHLHVIADIHIPETEFGRLAIKAGFGFQVRIKKITGIGAKYYLTKYLTKEWKNEEAWQLRKAYKCRIISFSRGLLDRCQRGSEWNLLLRGESLDTCIDRIHNIVTWQVGRKRKVTWERLTEGYYELSIDWGEEGFLRSITWDEDWAPDDWVPK
jgi:hypothetical protein